MKKLLLAAILFLMATSAQAVPLTCVSHTGVSTATLSCNISVTNGDKVIMIVNGGSLTTVAASSTPSLTWTQEQQSSTPKTTLFDATANATGTLTFTATLGAAESFWAMFGYDNGPLGVIDQSSNNAGSASAPTTNVTTTVNNDLIVVGVSINNGTSYTLTNMTVEVRDTSDSGAAVADASQGTAGAFTTTGSVTGGWGIVMVAYKPPIITGGAMGGAAGIGGKAGIGYWQPDRRRRETLQ